LKKEKLSLSKGDFAHLQNALNHPWTEEDDKNLWNSEQKYKRVGDLISGAVALLISYSEHRIGTSHAATFPITNASGAL